MDFFNEAKMVQLVLDYSSGQKPMSTFIQEKELLFCPSFIRNLKEVLQGNNHPFSLFSAKPSMWHLKGFPLLFDAGWNSFSLVLLYRLLEV